MNKRVLIGLGIVIVALAGWFIVRSVWFAGPEIPNLPPTAEELERMRAIDESSSQQADDARAGVGVFEPGTLPAPAPVEESTTTDTTEEVAL